jgi:hypothetical protein
LLGVLITLLLILFCVGRAAISPIASQIPVHEALPAKPDSANNDDTTTRPEDAATEYNAFMGAATDGVFYLGQRRQPLNDTAD